MLSIKKRSIVVTNYLRKVIKSSYYVKPYPISDLQKACTFFEAGKKTEDVGLGTAKDLLSIYYMLGSVSCRVPVLDEFTQNILNNFVENNESIILRKKSIYNIQQFQKMKFHIIDKEWQKVKSISDQIFNSNLSLTKIISKHMIKQAYEADPFFNVAKVVNMTFGLYGEEEDKNRVKIAMETMNYLMKNDMSENQKFSPVAQKYSFTLLGMLGE